MTQSIPKLAVCFWAGEEEIGNRLIYYPPRSGDYVNIKGKQYRVHDIIWSDPEYCGKEAMDVQVTWFMDLPA